jgi:hypothetical protein
VGERCPLVPMKNHWDGEIPEICRANCEETWDAAVATQPVDIDEFTRKCDAELGDEEEELDGNEECRHDVENGGVSIQLINKQKRAVIILNVCAATGTELFSESYDFICENP